MVLDLQDQVLSPKVYLSQRDKGQGIRHKDRRQRTREKGKGTKERWKGYLSGVGWGGGDKQLPLDRERQTRPIGK